MKYFMMAVLLTMSFNLWSYDSIDCYNKLLNGQIDSSMHQVNILDVTQHDLSLKYMALTGLRKLYVSLGCKPDFKEITCGQAIPNNDLTKICYTESKWGYFLINKDYLDNINIVFNRWD